MEILNGLALLAALFGAQEPQVKSSPVDQIRQIALIYTVNTFGNTEPVGCPHKILHDGGLARRMTCIRELAAAGGRPVLILDGGSTFFPEAEKPQESDREKLFLKGELIAEAMHRMGYQAMAVGSTDLLLGLGELTSLAGRVKFPLLSGNLTGPSGTPFKPYTVVETGGLKVGVVGLLIDTIGKVYLGKVAPGGRVLSSVETARKSIEELKGKVDLIVALSHNRQETNLELAGLAGIDIVIDPSIEYGNHHPRIKDEEWEKPTPRSVILRADGNGSSLGMVEIDFRRAGAGMGSRARVEELEANEKEGKITEEERAELKDLRGRNLYYLRRIPLSPHYADDPEAVALLDTFKNGGDLAGVPARPAPGAKSDYLTAAACLDCHPKQHQFWAATSHQRAMEPIRELGEDRKPECISCHATGYGPAFISPADLKTFGGVQCEACHGTSPEHPADPVAHRFGSISESVCLPCHNEDIVKKDFSYGSALKRVQCPSGK
jgi:2',3'-cyclic-nucleotide 2'-phosphodiesterase (5'-nucleotidase family)